MADQLGAMTAKLPDGKRYTFIPQRVIGHGVSGEVWLAQQMQQREPEGDSVRRTVWDSDASETGEPEDKEVREDVPSSVALKVTYLLKFKGYLAREAELLDHLWHREPKPSRIVRLLSGPRPCEPEGDWSGAKPAFLVLEYLDGETLDSWMKRVWFPRRPVPPMEAVREAASVGVQIAEALAELQHDGARIMHRDIKPANLMRSSVGLRLFDFNVAREQSESDLTQGPGTALYRSPELIKSNRYDIRCDLYSLGVILWEILHQQSCSEMQINQWAEQFRIRWPPEAYSDLPYPVASTLQKVMTGLLVNEEGRIPTPDALLPLLYALEQAVKPQPVAAVAVDDLPARDLISLLCELRPSGESAVVANTTELAPLQAFIRNRTHVDDPLEDYLATQARASLDGRSDAPRLIILAGNAGDGKSHLIHRLVHVHLADHPGVMSDLCYVADATHASGPTATQQEEIETFFAPFAQVEPPRQALHLIAMNTGMVIRFFEAVRQRRAAQETVVGDLDPLYAEVGAQLGLHPRSDATYPHHVEVINLDLRSMLDVVPGTERCFAERMLDRLDPENQSGLTFLMAAACADCDARPFCPVSFNLNALASRGHPGPRRAVLHFLRRAALDPEVHLSPRNLWGFWYRLLTGGSERYQGISGDGPGFCDAVRACSREENLAWLLRGHFSNVLFDQGNRNGAMWRALADTDPAYVTAPMLDKLHTRLSVRTTLDSEPELIEEALDAKDGVLAGLQLRRLLSVQGGLPAAERRNAAIRRLVMFNEAALATVQQYDGFEEFERLITAYDALSRQPDGEMPRPEHREPIRELSKLVQDVLVKSHGLQLGSRRFLRVSQPNARSQSQLLTEASGSELDEVFSPLTLIVRDAQIRAHRNRPDLLAKLGYRARLVTLSINRRRLTIDPQLYDFLLQVRRGRQPSARDLAQFEALLFVGESLGNFLAGRHNRALFIKPPKESLLRLSQDAFGEVSIKPVTP
ncbi:MAG: protein kinase [Polyangia bacterium]|nr:protein kinase [Polyangia bacterium]